MITNYQHLDDYEIGETGTTRARTVGEPEIANFACITCDYSYVHVAHHSTVDGPYGGRIAHGLLGTSLAAGLLSLDAPQVVGRDVSGGFLYGFDANYREAIRLGETIRIAWKTVEKQDDQDQEDYGIVRSDFEIITQDERPVYDGHFLVKVPKRSAGQDVDSPPDLASPAPWETEPFSLEPEKTYILGDFTVGEGGITSGRTVTEADITNFAGLTGDYNPLYVDDHFAKQGPFKGRIAPGLFAFNMAFGLWMRDAGVNRTRSNDTSRIAGHLNDSALFYGPIQIGDTVRCLYRIAETRVSRTKPQIGIIRYGFQLLNQRDEVVQEGKTLMLRSTS